MSRRAKREAEAAKRQREQVARLIAEVVVSRAQERWVATRADQWVPSGELREGIVGDAKRDVTERILKGLPFDVARAREYGTRLVELGEHFDTPSSGGSGPNVDASEAGRPSFENRLHLEAPAPGSPGHDRQRIKCH